MKTTTMIIAFFVIFFFGQRLSAQPWMQQVKSANPTFYEIQQAFNEYWQDRPVVKGEGYKQFKRWEHYWEQRVGKDGIFPASDYLYTEWDRYSKEQAFKSGSSLNSADWTFMGPTGSPGGYNGLGRISCIAFHPTDPQSLWVGTPAGGLWKSTDGGDSWFSSSYSSPVLGVSDIAIDPTLPSVMYIATGDGDAAFSLFNGAGDTKSIGVLRSENGGLSFSPTGLNWEVTENKLIRRIVIAPGSANILLAATSDGIYRTSNYGNAWTKQQEGWFMDVEFANGVACATTFDYNGNAQIFYSQDHGVTWVQATTFTGYTRIELAVSTSGSNLVKAICVNASGGLGGLWTSTNRGKNWTQDVIGDCTNNFLGYNPDASGCNGQGWYDLAYAINPSNPNELFLGGVNTWRSTNGGYEWSLNNIWTSSLSTGVPVVHADKHFIAFNPHNNNQVFECNDGGLYITDNGGQDWVDLTDGMGISQIYRIGVYSKVSISPEFPDVINVICGLQDNGTKKFFGSQQVWNEMTGGDGMECIIDYTDVNILYSSSQNGKIFKSTNGGTNWSPMLNNNDTTFSGIYDPGANGPGAWVTPYIMHPTDHNTLYIGKSQVYVTSNGGASWSQFGTIPEPAGKLVSLAYALPGTIYAATEYQLFKTTDAGASWNLITTSTERITYLAIDPADNQRLYVTFSGYNAGNKVQVSPDGGISWLNYSQSLPNVPVNCIVYQIGTDEGLYVGTDMGVFYRDASMAGWIPYNLSGSLPNVVVNELEISYDDNKLWAATFGRGLWSSSLYNTAAVNEAQDISSQINIYPNPANNQFAVQGPDNVPYDLAVYNNLGEKIMEEKNIQVPHKTINLKNVNPGMYIVRFVIENKTISRKMIIEK